MREMFQNIRIENEYMTDLRVYLNVILNIQEIKYCTGTHPEDSMAFIIGSPVTFRS